MASVSAGVRSAFPILRFRPRHFKNYKTEDVRVVADLPKPYQKFYREWVVSDDKETPVHWIPRNEKWERNPETGEVKIIQNEPIPVKYPKQMHKGLWGGEAVVEGLVKKGKYRSPVPRFWMPRLQKTVVHSEILDKYLSVVVTERALKLIDESNGLDAYLIKTPAYDLKSLLALKLKRKILFALLDKDFCHNNLERQEEILRTYQDYLKPREELEWYGYSVDEALNKYNQLQVIQNKAVPLKEKLRAAFIENKIEEEENKSNETVDETSNNQSWAQKLNPFTKPKEAP